MLHPLEHVRDHHNPLADTTALVSCQAPQLGRPRFAAKEICRHTPSPKHGTLAHQFYHIWGSPEAGISPKSYGISRPARSTLGTRPTRDAPCLGVAANRVVAAAITEGAQLLEYPDQRQPLARRLALVRQQQRVDLGTPRADLRQRLPAALITKLGRLRPDHLAHNLPRHPKLAANRLDRLLSSEIRAPDLRDRLHYQHPQPGPHVPMEATVDPPSRGSRLDADHPLNGVLIPRRFTFMCSPS